MPITIGKGIANNPDYIDFINYVFGMNGAERSFPRLLPKLFAPGRDPAADTYFAMDGDRILAAVGAFPLTFEIAGQTLRAGGIGNVATHPRARGTGLMKACMAAATADLIAAGCDFSVLSGRRHRYAHFGYEKCGNDYQLEITGKTVRYVAGEDFAPRLTLHRISPDDAVLLDAVAALHDRRPYRVLRSRADLYDILTSWQATPYAFLDGGNPVGFAVLGDHGVLDFALDDPAWAADALALLTGQRWNLCVHLPLWDADLLAALLPYAENCLIGADICFSVYRWERVLSALLALKSGHARLIDGEMDVRIRGIAGEERLRITVAGGIPAVEPLGSLGSLGSTAGSVDVELDHMEAMGAFFLNATPLRDRLPAIPATWFPLEIGICESDNV